MVMGFICGLLGKEQARPGWWVDGREELLALKFSACRLKVSMGEDRCGSERRGREGHQMVTFLREGSRDMGTRVNKEDALYTGDSTKVIAWFPEHPPALSIHVHAPGAYPVSSLS